MALLASMILVLLIGISALVAFSRGTDSEATKQRRTDEALAQAKAALIGYAIGRPLETTEPQRRLGELPCPDLDGDGDADIACDSEASRLGRLPWKTLGLPDLRDGDGERLWYAVSHTYKMNPRTTCSLPEDAGCLNSDAAGSITVRDAQGNVTHSAVPSATLADPANFRGAVAIVIAPGATLVRQDGTAQVRDATGSSQAINYLDNAFGEDNVNFTDYATNGFIAGPVRNAASGEVIANDRIAIVTHEELIPVLEKRVVQEVANCLDAYAAANLNRYPWAADLTESAINHNYADSTGRLTGRIPQTLNNTHTNSSNAMNPSWPAHPSCFLGLGLRWWDEWKLRVFYAVADSYKPGATPPTACASCMFVYKATSTIVDVRYFVAVAGRRLQGVSGNQPRTTTLGSYPETLYTAANFLEQENAAMFTTPGQFEVRSDAVTASFNDVTAYKN